MFDWFVSRDLDSPEGMAMKNVKFRYQNKRIQYFLNGKWHTAVIVCESRSKAMMRSFKRLCTMMYECGLEEARIERIRQVSIASQSEAK